MLLFVSVLHTNENRTSNHM
uniref:Uncharacterized protein n=1 Tax=Arundo donax TaxID=35708 RepID=A0A0A8Z4W1_ARUDO